MRKLNLVLLLAAAAAAGCLDHGEVIEPLNEPLCAEQCPVGGSDPALEARIAELEAEVVQLEMEEESCQGGVVSDDEVLAHFAPEIGRTVARGPLARDKGFWEGLLDACDPAKVPEHIRNNPCETVLVSLCIGAGLTGRCACKYWGKRIELAILKRNRCKKAATAAVAIVTAALAGKTVTRGCTTLATTGAVTCLAVGIWTCDQLGL